MLPEAPAAAVLQESHSEHAREMRAELQVHSVTGLRVDINGGIYLSHLQHI